MQLALTHGHPPQPLSLTHHHRGGHSFNSVAFPKAASSSSLTARASFRNPVYETIKHQIPKFVTGVTVAAIFLSRFTAKPAIAASYPHPEEHHVADLKNIMMETEIENGKFEEGRLLKHSYRKDDELKSLEKRILEGLEICEEWSAAHRRSLEAMVSRDLGKRYDMHKMHYETWRTMDHVRDFKFTVAQILVMQGDYNEALKICKDLSEEEPQDLKPYLCQGIIYTLLGKQEEAENIFVKVKNISSPIPGKWDYIYLAFRLALPIIVIAVCVAKIYESEQVS